MTGEEAAAILGPSAGFLAWLTGPRGEETLRSLSWEHGAEAVRGILRGYASGEGNRPGGWARARGMTVCRFLTSTNAHTASEQWRKANGWPSTPKGSHEEPRRPEHEFLESRAVTEQKRRARLTPEERAREDAVTEWWRSRRERLDALKLDARIAILRLPLEERDAALEAAERRRAA